MDLIAAEHPRWFIKAPSQWLIPFVEESMPQYYRNTQVLHEIMQMMMEGVHLATLAPDAPEGYRQRVAERVRQTQGRLAYDQTCIRKVVSSRVLRRHPDQLSPGEVTNFPGPMAVTLGRKHFPLLRENKFWVTEKSDGTRVMMYARHEPWFPKWLVKFKDPQSGQDRKRQFHLADCLALEQAYQQATGFGKMQTVGGRGHAQLSCATECILEVVSLPQGQFRLVNWMMKPQELCRATEWEHEQPSAERFGIPSIRELMSWASQHRVALELRRIEGWTFSYFFDRTYDFYLCTEELIFATEAILDDEFRKSRPPTFAPSVIADGELIVNLARNNRLNFSLYDLVEVGTDGAQGRPVQTLYAGDRSLSEKKRLLKQSVVDPHHLFYAAYRMQPRPASVQIVLKHFWAPGDLKQVLERIQRDPKDPHRFIYNGYNYNDGLVFTPDDPKLYRFAPGRADNLLKWKWPERLTVDFGLKRRIGNLWDLFYNEFGKHIMYKTVKLEEFESTKDGLIAECFFDAKDSQSWKVSHVRTDKTLANAFRTASSTLENMAEGIVEAELVDLMERHHGNREKGAVLHPESGKQDMIQECVEHVLHTPGYCLAHFNLRLSAGAESPKLELQYRQRAPLPDSSAPDTSVLTFPTETETYRLIWRNLAPESVSYGDIPYFASKSVQDKISSGALASSTVPYLVRCAFVPNLGRWVVVDDHCSTINRCSDIELLQTLEQIASVAQGVVPFPGGSFAQTAQELDTIF